MSAAQLSPERRLIILSLLLHRMLLRFPDEDSVLRVIIESFDEGVCQGIGFEEFMAVSRTVMDGYQKQRASNPIAGMFA